MILDTFTDISRILEHDSTTTTYKYSLIKSVIESCREYPQYVTLNEETNRVTLPLGICVMKWLIDYYPFFIPGTFIALKHGEKKGGFQGVVFREYFEKVCSWYESPEHGGISVFADDIIHGTVPREIAPVVVKLAALVRSAIVNGPMKHFGYSGSGEAFSVFRIESKAYPFKPSVPLSRRYLIERCGTYSISKDLWLVFRDLGGFIPGQGSVRQKWIDFLVRANAAEGVTEEEILKRFAMVPTSGRDVSDASKVYQNEVKKGECVCVWSGKTLTLSTIAIDHLFPFAVLKSNDLWNLVPADASVNLEKSDKVPSAEFLRERKAEIFSCWSRLFAAYPMRFEEETAAALLHGDFSGNWMERAFEELCRISEFLTGVRGCDVYSGKRR